MYWVIQEDLYQEHGLQALREILARLNLPHSIHAIVPGTLSLVPEVSPGTGAVVVIGAYTMNRIAKAREWVPGAFINENFDFRRQREEWGRQLLNSAAIVAHLDAVPPQQGRFFVRPVVDSKSFTGRLFEDWVTFSAWRDATKNASWREAEVMICPAKHILREARLWVVDKEVVTGSVYRSGGQVRYEELLPSDPLIVFAAARIAEWVPARAFVLDVCDTSEGERIVETNNLNASALYAANVGKLVMALESMGFG